MPVDTREYGSSVRLLVGFGAANAFRQTSQEDVVKLERWGRMLRRNRFLRLEVHGHTDATGPEGYNAVLSKRRAETVFEYLLDIGVAPDRMRTD